LGKKTLEEVISLPDRKSVLATKQEKRRNQEGKREHLALWRKK
jgi:hypothetical protein